MSSRKRLNESKNVVLSRQMKKARGEPYVQASGLPISGKKAPDALVSY